MENFQSDDDIEELERKSQIFWEKTFKNISIFDEVVKDSRDTRLSLTPCPQTPKPSQASELTTQQESVFECRGSQEKERKTELTRIRAEVCQLKKVVSHLIERIGTQDNIIRAQSSRLKSQGPERKSDLPRSDLTSSESNKFLTFPGQSIGLYITTVRQS